MKDRTEDILIVHRTVCREGVCLRALMDPEVVIHAQLDHLQRLLLLQPSLVLWLQDVVERCRRSRGWWWRGKPCRCRGG